MNKVTQAALAVFIGLSSAYFAVSAVRYAIDALIQFQQVQAIDDLPVFNVRQNYAPNEFQALIRIETQDTLFAKSHFNCSGTVISDDYVLTAAHCLTNSRGGLTSNKFRIVSLPNQQKEVFEVVGTPATFSVRADYALIKGDFRRFTKLPIQMDLDIAIFQFGENRLTACGFPWGESNGLCYPFLTKPEMMDFQFAAQGRLYPGMSGGPVLDMKTGLIVAVNTAVNGQYIIVSPVIALFDNLGVQVVQ